MTKKDLKLFAYHLHNMLIYDHDDISIAVKACERVFGQEKPMFDHDEFEKACYEGGEID